jgi:hypothetical protein
VVHNLTGTQKLRRIGVERNSQKRGRHRWWIFSWAMSHICANDEYRSQVGTANRPVNIVIRYVSVVSLSLSSNCMQSSRRFQFLFTQMERKRLFLLFFQNLNLSLIFLPEQAIAILYKTKIICLSTYSLFLSPMPLSHKTTEALTDSSASKTFHDGKA